MKKISISVLLSLTVSVIFSQVSSPEQFLGYKLGTRFTPHYKIVDYFKHLAEQAADLVKLEQYGETNEGRPLLLAFIASPENHVRLEAIRKNNLRLAGVNTPQATAIDNPPAIVWLSYNVHGNEASSSEAAMLTLFELVNPSNSKTKVWLKNTVVIIDPCINPDGRDRYLHWFNTVSGKLPNPQSIGREHNEPWPGGRSNHYYFDLNRDWAWQTQIESQQRLLKYNQWLPHVHVDYHEQGYNEPYYFAPAAEPFHEVITAWQRDFQIMIGRNNAKYFDENAWLYFTKERFDLFYPSYGDTYPTYKGAIGMTYEQGGGPRGGTAIITEEGDTLTLWDRLFHHYITGMSTIEITSLNANKIVDEFRKYYEKARTSPSGEFKAYLIKADEGDRIDRLKSLLDKNSIDWFYVTGNSNLSLTGINYYSGKRETYRPNAKDIVVNSNQPNSNLLEVLFDRTTKLSDSATYDITAWSVPYAYGLSTIGLHAYVNTISKNPPQLPKQTVLSPTAYAYAVRWNGLNSARFLSELLSKNIKVRYAEQAFSVKNEQFDKGTLLITRSGNLKYGSSLENVVSDAAQKALINFFPIESGFVDKGFDIGSDKVRIIKAPRVTLLAGETVSSLSMGEVWHFFEREINYPVNIVNAGDVNRFTLKETDVLIIPNGNYQLFSDKSINDALKDWVNTGGRLIAIENAVAQMSKNEWGIKLKGKEDDMEKDKEKDKEKVKKGDMKEEKKEDYSLLHRYENRERDFIPGNNPGSIFKIELDNSHPLAFGYPDIYYTLKLDDNIYEFIKEDGWNVGVLKKQNFVTGFTGSKTKEKLIDGVLFGVLDIGRGNVIFLADNPIFRSFWENGKLLFCNAVFMVGQ